MQSKIKISNATINDIEAIVTIATDTLGAQYLSHAQISAYLENKKYLCHKANLDNELVGFSLSRYCSTEELRQILLIDRKEFDQVIKMEAPFYFRETTAVKKEYRNIGVGNQLIKQGYALAKGHAKSIITVAWQQVDSIPVANIIMRHGSKKLKAFPKYWQQDSIDRNYNCRICGTPPCQCTGIIFVKEL